MSSSSRGQFQISWGRLPRFSVGVVDEDHDVYFPFRSDFGESWVWNGRRLVEPSEDE